MRSTSKSRSNTPAGSCACESRTTVAASTLTRSTPRQPRATSASRECVNGRFGSARKCRSRVASARDQPWSCACPVQSRTPLRDLRRRFRWIERHTLSSRHPGLTIQARGHGDELGEGAGLHLAHHLAAMRLHRDLGNAELAANLLVQPARDHEAHDLALAPAEGLETMLQRLDLRQVKQRGLATFYRIANGVEQDVTYDGLGQELERPRLDRLYRRGNVDAIAHEDQRCFEARGDQFLKFEPAHARQVEFQQQAAWPHDV